MLTLLKLVLGNRWGQAALIVLGLLTWWQVDRHQQFNAGVKAGESKVIEQSAERNKENAAKSKQAHAAARKPGAFERMRKDPMVCRECK